MELRLPIPALRHDVETLFRCRITSFVDAMIPDDVGLQFAAQDTTSQLQSLLLKLVVCRLINPLRFRLELTSVLHFTIDLCSAVSDETSLYNPS